MSGATNQGGFGNTGAGPSPWGPGAWSQQNGQSGRPWGNPWPGNAYGLWSISRPLLIAGTIIGFMFWWPIGLALLFLAIWNKKMGRWAFGGCGPGFQGGWTAPNTGGNGGGWTPPWAGWKSWCGAGTASRAAPQSSGNHAFDEYRDQMLKRLEEEQHEFSAFLERLRFARDKAEFDQFMADRRQPPVPTTEPPHPES